jgi:hypothetical protein
MSSIVITVGETLDADGLRIPDEFVAAPQLQVSVDNVVARLHVQPRHALLILESLVGHGFLARTVDLQYVRAAAGCCYRGEAATAWAEELTGKIAHCGEKLPPGATTVDGLATETSIIPRFAPALPLP